MKKNTSIFFYKSLNKKYFFIPLTVAAISFTSAQAETAQPQSQAPATHNAEFSLNSLLLCRNLDGSELRLACFETQAEFVAQQIATGELVPVYKTESYETRRRNFGINSLKMPDFLANKEDPMEQISTTLTSARQDANGRWRFHLADGSIWEQVDSTNPHLTTRPGTGIEIRRGALNSYLMNVGSARAIRVARRP